MLFLRVPYSSTTGVSIVENISLQNHIALEPPSCGVPAGFENAEECEDPRLSLASVWATEVVRRGLYKATIWFRFCGSSFYTSSL